MKHRTKVLLADDHAIVAEGLAILVKGHFDLVRIVSNGNELIEAARKHRPDVIVADIAMPVLSGLEALRRLKATRSEAKVIFLTMHADAQLATEAFRAGASGYVLKQSAGEELIAAIQEVLQGRTYLTPLMTNGITAAAEILRRNPAARIVFVTVYNNPVLVEKGLATGALGYVLKLRAGDDLVPAIHAVLRGEHYLSPNVTASDRSGDQ